jgi:hypothetical protein
MEILNVHYQSLKWIETSSQRLNSDLADVDRGVQ